jgi:chemotaxis protein CheD
MIEYKLNIGDVVTSVSPASYVCFGLGSCIGLFIQDRTTGLSAGAHIFLPEEENEPCADSKFYSATAAVNEILEQFKLHGNDLSALRAKVAGGANVLHDNLQTGKRNSKAVVNHLVERKIFIAALDVGGVHCRTAKFQSRTGQMTVRISETNESRIY